MANSTLTPNSREEQDEYNDPMQTRRGLSELEQQSARDRAITDAMEIGLANPSDAIRAEENRPRDPNNPMGFSPSGNRSSSRRNKPSTIGTVLRKGSPYGFAGGILGFIIFLLFNFFPLMPIHIYHAFLDKYDSQNTSYTVRLDKVIQAKISNKVTDGVCTDMVQIRCRFSRPSNTMLKRLDKLGIMAIDSKGNTASRAGLFPNARPAYYEIPDGNSKTRIIKAADFSTELKNNSDFRAAFHTAVLSRILPFSDSIFKSVVNLRFGLTTKDNAADAATEKDVTDSYNEGNTGKDTGAKDATTNDEAKKVIQPIIEDEASKEVTQISNAGKADAIGLVAGATCAIADAPGIVTRAARVYEMAEFIKDAEPVMVSINAMINGDATSTEVSAVGNMLTQEENGHSALDSYAFKSTLYGATAPSPGEDYEKYVPGGETNKAIGGVTTITDSDAKKNVCAVATNPVTGLATNAALAPETLGIGTLINIALGFAASTVLQVAGPPVINLIMSSIPPQTYLQLMTMFFGDKVTNAAGIDKGNLLGSGWMQLFGQIANKGGNMPLSPSEQVNYASLTNQVNVAYAQEDRATHSPLDASNSNTMMGAFVTQLLPLYSNMGSLASTLSSVSSIATNSFGSILGGQAFAASTDESQYTQCDDPSLKDIGGNQVAAGPFCNIQYGIPTQYLNMDSQTIVDDLVAQGQIDSETGEPVDTAGDFVSGITDAVGLTSSTAGTQKATIAVATNQTKTTVKTADDSVTPITSLKKWTDLCTDGTSASALNCQITNQQTAEYALYTIDHRIQKDLDDEDTDPSDGSTTATDTSTATDKVVLPAKKYTLGDGWGARVCPTGTGCASFHTAQDFIPNGDTSVYAATDGTVIYADKSNTLDNIVQIKAPNGVVTNYWHEEGKNILVSKGDQVTAGQKIGTMGCVGSCTGTHLHFEIDITDATDPALKKLITQTKGDIASFKTVRTYAKPSEWFGLYGLKM